MEVMLAMLGLALFAPAGLVIAWAIHREDRGPILFRQERVGLAGRPFEILKFRTMSDGGAGRLITAGGDPRVTSVGHFLRRTKLDEVPQLWNVVRGEMSFVGPRPEVPEYVALYTEVQRRVLDFRPGITDEASLAYRDEERLLGEQSDPDSFYVREVMPAKIAINLEYQRHRTLWSDLGVVFRTVVGSRGNPAGRS
jgi:lipopolysaccharide/colanic/teichoic acid biosynthesis glycosyltransferase